MEEKQRLAQPPVEELQQPPEGKEREAKLSEPSASGPKDQRLPAHHPASGPDRIAEPGSPRERKVLDPGDDEDPQQPAKRLTLEQQIAEVQAVDEQYAALLDADALAQTERGENELIGEYARIVNIELQFVFKILEIRKHSNKPSQDFLKIIRELNLFSLSEADFAQLNEKEKLDKWIRSLNKWLPYFQAKTRTDKYNFTKKLREINSLSFDIDHHKWRFRSPIRSTRIETAMPRLRELAEELRQNYLEMEPRLRELVEHRLQFIREFSKIAMGCKNPKVQFRFYCEYRELMLSELGPDVGLESIVQGVPRLGSLVEWLNSKHTLFGINSRKPEEKLLAANPERGQQDRQSLKELFTELAYSHWTKDIEFLQAAGVTVHAKAKAKRDEILLELPKLEKEIETCHENFFKAKLPNIPQTANLSFWVDAFRGLVEKERLRVEWLQVLTKGNALLFESQGKLHPQHAELEGQDFTDQRLDFLKEVSARYGKLLAFNSQASNQDLIEAEERLAVNWKKLVEGNEAQIAVQELYKDIPRFADKLVEHQKKYKHDIEVPEDEQANRENLKLAADAEEITEEEVCDQWAAKVLFYKEIIRLKQQIKIIKTKALAETGKKIRAARKNPVELDEQIALLHEAISDIELAAKDEIDKVAELENLIEKLGASSRLRYKALKDGNDLLKKARVDPVDLELPQFVDLVQKTTRQAFETRRAEFFAMRRWICAHRSNKEQAQVDYVRARTKAEALSKQADELYAQMDMFNDLENQIETDKVDLEKSRNVLEGNQKKVAEVTSDLVQILNDKLLEEGLPTFDDANSDFDKVFELLKEKLESNRQKAAERTIEYVEIANAERQKKGWSPLDEAEIARLKQNYEAAYQQGTRQIAIKKQIHGEAQKLIPTNNKDIEGKEYRLRQAKSELTRFLPRMKAQLAPPHIPVSDPEPDEVDRSRRDHKHGPKHLHRESVNSHILDLTVLSSARNERKSIADQKDVKREPSQNNRHSLSRAPTASVLADGPENQENLSGPSERKASLIADQKDVKREPSRNTRRSLSRAPTVSVLADGPESQQNLSGLSDGRASPSLDLKHDPQQNGGRRDQVIVDIFSLDGDNQREDLSDAKLLGPRDLKQAAAPPKALSRRHLTTDPLMDMRPARSGDDGSAMLDQVAAQFASLADIKRLSDEKTRAAEKVDLLQSQLDEMAEESSPINRSSSLSSWTRRVGRLTSSSTNERELMQPLSSGFSRQNSSLDDAPQSAQELRRQLRAAEEKLAEANKSLQAAREAFAIIPSPLPTEVAAKTPRNPKTPIDEKLEDFYSAEERRYWTLHQRSWRRYRTEISAGLNALLVGIVGGLMGFLALRTTGIGYAIFEEEALKYAEWIIAGLVLETALLAHQFGKPMNLRTARTAGSFDRVFAQLEMVQNIINEAAEENPEPAGRFMLSEDQRQVLHQFTDDLLLAADPRSASGKKVQRNVWARGQEDVRLLAALRNSSARGWGLFPRQVSIDYRDLERLNALLVVLRSPGLLGAAPPPPGWREKHSYQNFALENLAMSLGCFALLVPGLLAGNVDLMNNNYFIELQETYGETPRSSEIIAQIIAWTGYYLPCALGSMLVVVTPQLAGQNIPGKNNFWDYGSWARNSRRLLLEQGHGRAELQQIGERKLVRIEPHRIPVLGSERTTSRSALWLKSGGNIALGMAYPLMLQTGPAYNENDEVIYGPKRLDNPALVWSLLLVFVAFQLHISMPLRWTRNRLLAPVPLVREPKHEEEVEEINEAREQAVRESKALDDDLFRDERAERKSAQDVSVTEEETAALFRQSPAEIASDPSAEELPDLMAETKRSQRFPGGSEYVLEMFWSRPQPQAQSQPSLRTEMSLAEPSVSRQQRASVSISRSQSRAGSFLVKSMEAREAELSALKEEIAEIQAELAHFKVTNQQDYDKVCAAHRNIMNRITDEEVPEDRMSQATTAHQNANRIRELWEKLPKKLARQSYLSEALKDQWLAGSEEPGSRASFSASVSERGDDEKVRQVQHPKVIPLINPRLPARPQEPWGLRRNDLLPLAEAQKALAGTLCQAVANGDLEEVEDIIGQQPDLLALQINYHITEFAHDIWEHFSLLLLAIVNRQFAVAEFLVKQGVDPSIITQGIEQGSGNSRLMTAIDFLEDRAWRRSSDPLYNGLVQALRAAGAKTFYQYQTQEGHHQLSKQPRWRVNDGKAVPPAPPRVLSAPSAMFPAPSPKKDPGRSPLPFFNQGEDDLDDFEPNFQSFPIRPAGAASDLGGDF